MALIQGVTNATTPPAPTLEGVVTPNALRTGKFNEQYILSLFPGKQLACLAGYYYTLSAGGTAVVSSLTALTEASPALIIENTALAGGPVIILDFVRIQATAVAAAATNWQYSWKVDNIRGKWGSGGSAITPQNTNMGAGNVSFGAVHFGALAVITANQSSTNARVVQAGFLTTTASAPATIIGDTADFRFGSKEAPLPTVLSNVASAAAHTFAVGMSVSVPPVILPPGSTATLFLWGSASATAASYELNAGYYEY